MSDVNPVTPSYVELMTETATKIVDASADLAHRAIRSTRSLWQIVSAPYGTTDVQTIVSANFDRASDIATVVTREVKHQLDATQHFNEMLLGQAVKFQDAYLNALRGVLDIGVSNLTFVQEAAAVQVQDLTKRFDDYVTPAGAVVSTN